jgi:Putative auto-transporter adhesin, head GIN domain
MIKPTYLITPLLAVALAAGCANQSGRVLQGSGEIAEQRRPVKDFTGVEFGPGFTGEVLSGERFEVVVRGDRRFLSYVDTRIEFGSLVVRMSDIVAVRPRTPLSVSVRVPHVDRLSVTGSRVNLTGLSGDTMALRVMSGSQVRAHVRGKRLAMTVGERSRVDIDGHVQVLRAEISGASEVRALQLHARSATVAVAPGAKLELQTVGKDGRGLALK